MYVKVVEYIDQFCPILYILFIPLQFDVITDWSRLFNVDIKSSRIYDAR